jgi:hypothetical protein
VELARVFKNILFETSRYQLFVNLGRIGLPIR